MNLHPYHDFIAKAREGFAAARASYGVVRKVNLISARHALKWARRYYNASRGEVVA